MSRTYRQRGVSDSLSRPGRWREVATSAPMEAFCRMWYLAHSLGRLSCSRGWAVAEAERRLSDVARELTAMEAP